MKLKEIKLTYKIIIAIVLAAVIDFASIACIGLQISFVKADKIVCWRPDYEEKDISAILEKSELDEHDYTVLYSQTGLTKIGIDRALEKGTTGKLHILEIQKDFFKEHKVINEFFAPFVCQDKIDGRVSYIYLEDGDIVVTSSTHISGWRAGHAGLVTDAQNGRILQASAIGETSSFGSMKDFHDRVNFIILSPRTDEATKSQVVKFAEENLVGKIYDPTVGVFSKKNTSARTQCAHLVWYAYNKFGTDLDATGGPVVTPHDLLISPYVDIVQVFGINPIKLWK